MPNSTTITLADGRRATISGAVDAQTHQASLSVQFADAAGNPIGGPQVLEQTHGSDGRFIVGTSIDTQGFAATALSNGGLEVVFNGSEADSQGFVRQVLIGVGVDAQGHVVKGTAGEQDGLLTGNFRIGLDGNGDRVSGAVPVAPHLAELDGGRFAVTYDTFDASNAPTAHVALGNLGGVYADVPVASLPDAITHANGDITLTWNVGGAVEREVLGEDGAVLSPRGASNVVTAHVNEGFAPGFDPLHDQIRLIDADGSVAHGATSTLTFDARTHVLSWDQDSEGPAPATTALVLNGVSTLSVANLADDFRPEVLKVIAADGASTVQWFDSDHSQTWDTLLAVFNPAGQLTTYGSTLDDGTGTTFHFDVDASQPWQRYVDRTDAAGHVVDRTVLVDNGQSWEAIYTYAGGQVVSYEVDSFDVNGQLVGKGFFHADGTPI